MKNIIFTVLFIVMPLCDIRAESVRLPEYTVFRRKKPVVIDGILDDPDWVRAPAIGPLQFHRLNKYPGTDPTVVKLLWDNNFLYLW